MTPAGAPPGGAGPDGAGPGAAAPEPPARLGLHLLLLVATFLSALYAQTPVRHGETVAQVLAIPWRDPARLWLGLPFAVTLMAILVAHELGHYLTARRYGVDQSLPYFIPAPIAFFGTLGAVILIRSPPANRRVLLDVAVMGPYAGLVVAVPAAAWGLHHSIPVDPNQLGGGIAFGDSLLFAGLERLFSPNGSDVILHPVAMAGWVGLFITSLNLIPAAQLDGGHVVYALFGRAQEKISLTVAVALFYFGLHSACVGDVSGVGRGGAIWLVWAGLLFVLGLRHPPVADESVRLGRRRGAHAVAALGLFVITFVPVPLRPLEAAAPRLEAPPLLGPSAPAPRPGHDDAPGDSDSDGDGDGDGDGAPRPARPAEEYHL